MKKESRYLPEKLCAIKFSELSIRVWIESVIWISPPFPGFCFNSTEKIVLGRIYLPITALLEGAVFTEGFSITFSIILLL